MTMIHDAATANPFLREGTYNLFRNNERPSLFCAVPEHRSVPGFIDAEAWSFERLFPARMSRHPVFTTEPPEQAASGLSMTARRVLPQERSSALTAHSPQSPAALQNSDPERGRQLRGVHQHICATNENVSMQQALLPTASLTITFPFPADTKLNKTLGSHELQTLGDRLRMAYGPVEEPLPVRLAELVERLVRREQASD